MALRRQYGPYVWITWLSKLLTGDNACEWAAWFKAHHDPASWDKAPCSFDQSQWLLNHSQALQTLAANLGDEGHQVLVEGQNSFRLRGKVATLGGKPDLLARSGPSGSIIDVKTGKPRPSDIVQVQLYMWAVPLALPQHRNVRFDGKVAYRDHEVHIPASSVDEHFVRSVTGLIARVASDTAPVRVPSIRECSFCQIGCADCPERVEAVAVAEAETEVF